MWLRSSAPSWRASRANVKHVEHKIIRGVGAGRWLPYARTKAAALHARARAQRVNALVQRWTVEGGDVEIAVRVVGDQRYIHIQRKTCPQPLSGFIDAIVAPMSAEPPLVPGTPLVQIPDPNDPEQQIHALRRFFPSVAQAPADGPRAWRDEPGLVTAGPQTVVYKASMYSGEMRKVVQVLQGMDKDVYYRPMHAITHGVFTGTTGGKWVIEVSAAGGVRAWPLNVCNAPILDAEGNVLLGYTPIQAYDSLVDEVTAALEAGKVRLLISPGDMQEFYGKLPYFPNCGWAFDSTGNHLANVCSTISARLKSWLYKIDITEADGAPVSAALSLVEAGEFWAPRHAAHMRFPTGVRSSLFALDPQSGIDVSMVFDIPIYCYYDGDELQVFRFSWDPNSGNTVTTDETEPCLSHCVGSPLTGANESGGAYATGGSLTSNPVPTFTAPGGAGPSIPTAYSRNQSFAAHSYGGATGVGFLVTVGGACTVGGAATAIELVDVGKSEWSLDGNEVVKNVFIVPAYDRECAYIGGKLDGTGVVRSNFGSAHGLQTKRSAEATPCITGLNLRTAQTIKECCVTSPTLTTIYDTTPGIPAPTENYLREFCDNGTHFVDWGSIPTPIGGVFSFGPVITGEAAGGVSCSCVGGCTAGVLHSGSSVSETTPTAWGSINAALTYYASGGVVASMPAPISVFWGGDVFDFLDVVGADMISVRDAFVPHRFIVSPDQYITDGPGCVTKLMNDYLVTEAGVNMAFVGVP